MLILDKRRAVEHMVALAAHLGTASAEAEPHDVTPRGRQRVAVYRRYAAAPSTEPARKRRRAAKRAMPSAAEQARAV